MKISKHIMNPMRVKVLGKLQECGETNENGLHSRVPECKKEAVKSAIQRFGELGLITYTGGGYFEISEKGIQYVAENKWWKD